MELHARCRYVTDQTSLFLNQVEGTLPWQLIRQFSTMPRWQPEDVNRAAQVIASHLASVGVPCTMYEPTIYLSIPYEASVSAGGTTFHAKPSAYGVSVPTGLEGELVYVPASYSQGLANFFAANLSKELAASGAVAGKIVLTEGFGIPGKVRELEAAGALGVVTINPGEDIHWAICTQVWGTPGLSDLGDLPKIPVLSVNRKDGTALQALAEKGSVVTLRSRLDQGWFKQCVPVVEIPGATSPDEFVLVHGHYDSWDVGVGDNATGDATLLELARVLWHNRKDLKRSVRVAWWPGHSTGRYAGSTWYADTFALDLVENCVVQINCDSPGCRWATTFNHLSVMPETEGIAREIIQDVAGVQLQAERPPRAGDWSFNNLGLSGMFMLSSTMPDELRAEKGYYAVGGCGGNIAWHTEKDTLEIADYDIMVRDIKVYLAGVLSFANAEILPLDWRATAASLGETLRAYQTKLGDAFSLEPSVTSLKLLNEQMDTFYQSKEKHVLPRETANAVLKQLSRILVPLDNSLRATFVHDRALPAPSLPMLSAADTFSGLSEEERPFAIVDLQRAQNRVVAGFRAATAAVKSALQALDV